MHEHLIQDTPKKNCTLLNKFSYEFLLQIYLAIGLPNIIIIESFSFVFRQNKRRPQKR